jgi:hypothetical protein
MLQKLFKLSTYGISTGKIDHNVYLGILLMLNSLIDLKFQLFDKRNTYIFLYI